MMAECASDQRCRLAFGRRGVQLEVVGGGEDPFTTHPAELVLQEPSEAVGLVKFCGPWKKHGTGLDKPVLGGAPRT
jgi:hypothetical protein